ncbi:LOW QUALITY PROTEIN: hypothetical protein BRADI_4g10530v3 [Brachypodium distachyon]|uniref:Uncharacterized protein n=1 Tax=Brachypodium distachyon TaxID=15368 RepID=A0A2K2CLY1_BRADI|nr:LOW QUALITY PROTEIN: hypothetical protein BRADI_4g10530v3 [Brachypodium distachyon]
MELATVAHLSRYAGGLISKITRAARTARQNKKDCAHLACRVSVIAGLLPHLQDPETARALAGLGGTLRDAHELVLACCRKKRSAAFLFRRLFDADRHAERFGEINGRIDSHLILIPLLTHVSIARRLDQILGAARSCSHGSILSRQCPVDRLSLSY